MKALILNVRLNSLYSIRIPFTWQSALTYPVLPPSAVIGLIANAIQRYKNDKHPIEYLKKVEEDVIWTGSKLLAPCLIKSYTTSAITKWEDTIVGKFTNALGRQFAYSQKIQIAVIYKDNDSLTEEITEAIITSPLTCGDSESPITIESPPEIKNVEEIIPDEIVETHFPVPFVKEIEIIDGVGHMYLMHERCLKRDTFPLRSYIVPIKEDRGILKPKSIILKVKGDGIKVYKIEHLATCIVSLSKAQDKTTKQKKPKKKN